MGRMQLGTRKACLYAQTREDSCCCFQLSDQQEHSDECLCSSCHLDAYAVVVAIVVSPILTGAAYFLTGAAYCLLVESREWYPGLL